jgi:carboxymethylenebutenolidase
VSGSVSESDPAVEGKMVEYDAKGAKIAAYLAKPKGNGPFPIVLICHENRGLTEHFKDVSRRFAKAGYAALAVDLLSREGGTAKVGFDAAAGALSAIPPERNVEDFRAGMVYMQSQPFVHKARVGVTGFCFGGAVAWRVATQIPEVKAVVPFYGANPPIEDVGKIKGAVLALYGGTDTRINAGIPAIEEAMKKENKTFEKIVYDGAGHAFFNDTGAAYNANAAKDAWAKMLAWFEKYLTG